MLAQLDGARAPHHRLILVVAPSGSGKTEALQEVAETTSARLVNVNLELSRRMLELTERERALRLPDLLGEIVGRNEPLVLLDNVEMLFDASFEQDPLRLLQGVSRNRTIVATWNGTLKDDCLTYAAPEHPEYRRYSRDARGDLLVVCRTSPDAASPHLGPVRLRCLDLRAAPRVRDRARGNQAGAGPAPSLLRLHYRRRRLPWHLERHLVGMLRRQPMFRPWPLGQIGPDRDAFFAFLQERWPIFLDRLTSGPAAVRETPPDYAPSFAGPTELPFDHPDVRVHVDTLLLEGALRPIAHPRVREIGDCLRGCRRRAAMRQRPLVQYDVILRPESRRDPTPRTETRGYGMPPR